MVILNLGPLINLFTKTFKFFAYQSFTFDYQNLKLRANNQNIVHCWNNYGNLYVFRLRRTEIDLKSVKDENTALRHANENKTKTIEEIQNRLNYLKFYICVFCYRTILHLVQSVPITTIFVSWNPTQAIQHYVIKLVCDLLQFCAFLWILRSPSPIKLTATI